MRRSLRTQWELLKPNVGGTVKQSQARQKTQHDQHARTRSLSVGEFVVVRNFGSGLDLVQGVVAKRLGPLTYLVDVLDGRLWKRHIAHVKKCGKFPHFVTWSICCKR